MSDPNERKARAIYLEEHYPILVEMALNHPIIYANIHHYIDGRRTLEEVLVTALLMTAVALEESRKVTRDLIKYSNAQPWMIFPPANIDKGKELK
jgi:hypothetical protein